MLSKVVLTFESVSETLVCDYSYCPVLFSNTKKIIGSLPPLDIKK